MATEVGKGVVTIEPDTKGFGPKLTKAVQGEASSVQKAGEQVGSKLGDGIGDGVAKSTQSVGLSVGKLAKGIAGTFAAIKIGEWVKGAVDQASRLEQAVGGTQAVFGKAADSVDNFAEHAAEGIGVSNAAARELTSSIGGVLKGMGYTEEQAAKTSIQLATLGADLAATFGGKSEDAVRALGSALRGEFDPLQQFGISLNQTQINLRAVELGLAASTSNVDMNARAQAALSLIMERSSDAQGQFAAQSGTAAEQQQIAAAKAQDASAKFGANILPVYSKVQEVIGTVAEGFAALPGPIQTGLVALAGITALSGPLSSVIDVVGKIGPSLAKIGPAIAGFAAANPVLLGVAAAAAAVGAAFLIMGSREDEAARQGHQLAEALVSAASGFDKAQIATDSASQAVADFGDEVAGVSRKHLVEAVQKSTDLQEAFNTFGVSVDHVGAALKGTLSPELERAQAVSKAYTDFLEQKGGRQQTEYAASVGLTVEELQKLGPEAQRVVGFLDQQGVAAAKSTEELVRLAGAGDANAAAALKASGNYGLLNGAMLANADAALKAAAATDEHGAAAESASGSVQAYEGAVSDSTSATKVADPAAAGLSAAFGKVGEAAGDASEAIIGMMNAELALLDSDLGLQNAEADLRDKLDAHAAAHAKVVEEQKKHKAGSKEVVDATHAEEQSYRDLEGQVLNVAQAAVRQAQDQAKANGQTLSATQQNDALYNALQRQKQQYPQLSGVIDGYINKLGLIPPKKPTEVTVTDNGTAAATQGKINNIHGKSIAVDFTFSAADLATLNRAANLGALGALAVGGIVSTPSVNLIGEAGPEAVIPLNNPSRAMELMKQSGLYAMAVGEVQTVGDRPAGGDTIVIERVYGTVDREFVRMVQAEGARLRREWS